MASKIKEKLVLTLQRINPSEGSQQLKEDKYNSVENKESPQKNSFQQIENSSANNYINYKSVQPSRQSSISLINQQYSQVNSIQASQTQIQENFDTHKKQVSFCNVADLMINQPQSTINSQLENDDNQKQANLKILLKKSQSPKETPNAIRIQRKMTRYMQEKEQVYNKIMSDLKLRKKTFTKFCFKQIEKDEQPYLEQLMNKISNQPQKGSMYVIDLWSDHSIKKYLGYTNMNEGKFLLRNFCKSLTKNQKQKETVIMLTRKEEQKLEQQLKIQNASQMIQEKFDKEFLKKSYQNIKIPFKNMNSNQHSPLVQSGMVGGKNGQVSQQSSVDMKYWKGFMKRCNTENKSRQENTNSSISLQKIDQDKQQSQYSLNATFNPHHKNVSNNINIIEKFHQSQHSFDQQNYSTNYSTKLLSSTKKSEHNRQRSLNRVSMSRQSVFQKQVDQLPMQRQLQNCELNQIIDQIDDLKQQNKADHRQLNRTLENLGNRVIAAYNKQMIEQKKLKLLKDN